MAVGDLMLSDSPTTIGFGFASRAGGTDPHVVLKPLERLLDGGDVVFGNLEVVLSRISRFHDRRRADQMRADPSYAPALRDLGFDVLHVANNHAIQHGEPAFWNTVSALESAGIAACGVRGEGPWNSRPVEIGVQGRRIGFLGYCLRPRKYDSGPPPFAEGGETGILADIERLAARVESVVVSLHWGEDFVTRASRDEQRLARRAIRSGASVVLGHHPHVTRPVELHAGGIIAYSLGNFVSDMVWQEELRTSVVLRCELLPELRGPELRPCRIGDDYLPRWVAQGPVPEIVDDGAGDAVLDAAEYRDRAKAALREQRRSHYLHVLSRAHRIPLPVLASLVTATVRNKIASVVPRFTNRLPPDG